MTNKTPWQVGDKVILHYNGMAGTIVKIHNWQPLHDIVGDDGLKYPNQFASELSAKNEGEKLE